MLDRAERALLASTALLIVSGFLALATTPLFGPGVLVLPALMLTVLPIGARFDERHKGYRKATAAVTLAFTISLPFLYDRLGLYAVIYLIVFIQAHKLAHVRRPRDYHQLILMSFFLLVCACSQAPAPAIAPVLVLFLVCAVCSFVLLHVWGELRKSPRESLPDVGSIGSERPAFDGPNQALWQYGFGRWVALVCIACFLVMTGVFLVTPRMEAGLFQREGAAFATTDVSTEVDLSESGLIVPDSSIVMEVRFPEERDERYDGPMYWRINTFHKYEGSRWYRTGPLGSILDRSPEPIFSPYDTDTGDLRRTPSNRGRTVHQEVFLNETTQELGIPCLSMPVVVQCRDVPLAWSMDRQDYTVTTTEERSNLRYHVWSEVWDPGPEVLRNARDINYDWAIAQDYDMLVRHELAPRVVGLAREITAEFDSPYDKAMAVMNWLSSGDFAYTLDVPEQLSDNPVNAFVLQTRAGHCQLFASAMALMLRSQGIPARVVSGYRGGDWVEEDQAYEIRQDMAHMWAEVYFIDYGWVIFDPSPQMDVSVNVTPFAHFLSRLSLKARYRWHNDVIRYRGGLSWSRLRNMRFGIFGSARGFDGSLRAPEGGGSPAALLRLAPAAIPVLAALVGLSYMLQRRRVRGRPSGPAFTRDQLRATQLYRRLKSTVRRHGIRCAGKTAGEVLESLRDRPGVDLASASRIVEVYNATRFGSAALSPLEFVSLRRLARKLYASS